MCKFFGVSRSGYYNHLKHREQPHHDAGLAKLIAECQSMSNKTYGYRRVQMWLVRKKSLYFNRKTVLRVMNKCGLLSEICRRKKYKQMGQQAHKYENLLNRNFVADRPNAKWVTDISYIHTAQGVLYLSIIRDLYDNSKEMIAGELYLHSDQGFQYTSESYFNLTKEYGITPSMSRRGNCYDNAMAENFFSILKTECIYRHKIQTFDKARELIDEYIHFYNYERIQTKTSLTPLEKRSQSA